MPELTEEKLTWGRLNQVLKSVKTDWEAERMLTQAKAEKRGRRWLERIHSRFNYLRAQRERKELTR